MKTRGRHINAPDLITGAAWPNYFLLFGLAFLLDLVLGSRRLLGILPGPDDFIGKIVGFLRSRLDRESRSPTERFVRGLIVLIALIPLSYLLGHFLDAFIFSGTVSSIIFALVISRFIRQRRVWETMLATSRAYAGAATEAHFEQNRASIRQITLGFTDNIVCNMLVFTMGGLALLLPYRLLRCALDGPEGSYIRRPESPYLSGFSLLAELAALPGTLLASLLITMAHIFVPGTKAAALMGTVSGHKRALWSRLFPLNILAHGLGLSFRFSASKKAAWIGPENGRARQTAQDVRKAALILIVAMLLGILLAFFTLGFALSPQ